MATEVVLAAKPGEKKFSELGGSEWFIDDAGELAFKAFDGVVNELFNTWYPEDGDDGWVDTDDFELVTPVDVEIRVIGGASLKGYRTYLCLGLAFLACATAVVIHCDRPTGMRPSAISTGPTQQPIDWVLWLNIASGVLTVLAGVFRQFAAKDYAGALAELSRLRELLKRKEEETVDYEVAETEVKS